MLNRIDDINWKGLKHAYGSAEDVPDLIRALLSRRTKTREHALGQLYGNIFHQGTRYEATPYAVPFILELIESETTPDRQLLIIFLINLALGYEEEYLLTGFDVAKFRVELIETEEKLTSEERKEYEKYGYSARALLDIYDQVQKGIPILNNLVSHKDREISRAATYALAWFPENADESVKLIFNHLSLLNEEKDISNALLVIGHLNRSKTRKIDLSDFKKYLTFDSDLIRVSAAICLSSQVLDDDILNRLIDGLLIGKELEHIEGIYFNEGAILGYISLILSSFGDSKKGKIISALCETMESVNAYLSLDITSALILIINKDRKIPIKDTELEKLGDLEFMVLHTLLNHGGWQLGGSNFVNFSKLLRSGGIPDSQEELARYLQIRVSKFEDDNTESKELKPGKRSLTDLFRQFFRFK